MSERVQHGPNCWPWECVCELQMTFEETMAANAGIPVSAAEREQWAWDDEAEGKAIARAAEPDVEDEL